jgi:hypothetical protein
MTRDMRIYHLVLPLFICGCTARAEPVEPFGFSTESLLQHRLEGPREVDAQASSYDDVGVLVTIGLDGAVTDARADPQGTMGRDAGPAIAAARRWRFRPFNYRGRPVVAQGRVEISYRGRGEWGDPNAQFPPIDYASLRIELTRSACYGACPDYAVRIDGSGDVLFTTREPALAGAPEVHREFNRNIGVLIPGIHRGRIERPALDALIARFREARFFSLKSDYTAGVTDNPTYQLRFTSGGRSWAVTDYVGREAGMPAVVTALENEVDRVAGTARWTDGNEETVAALRQEGFDFSAWNAMLIAATATVERLVPRAPDNLIIGLIEAGLPLDRRFGQDADAAPLGEVLLLGAVRSHRPALFAALAGRGWLGRIPRDHLSLAFAEGAGGCDPAVARALVGAGADPRARTPLAPDPEIADEQGSTALLSALASYGPCHDVNVAPLIDTLLALGVDINAANQRGQTALFMVDDPALQERLLAAGARVDVRDRDGNSAALSSWTDVIALRLLEAGADPHGRDFEGKTLREQARIRNMPAVLRWLDAHNIR